ncbi:MAG: hypothetical protein WDM96_15420 [Lacunisphaera sp.]
MIVQIPSERGRIYFEPQTGREVALSPKEEASAYFRFSKSEAGELKG